MMRDWWALAAMMSAACTAWIHMAPVRRAPPVPDAEADGVPPSMTVVLGLLAVAIRSGASVPVALDAVGAALRGRFGGGLRRAASLLRRGASWDEAWAIPLADETHAGRFRLLYDTLGDAWRRGVSPVTGLETAMEQLDKDERAAIEQGASRLSVRLLMPTGLCFLPAFIAIGVIPSIVAFMA